jgi:hypothetical protein
MEGRSTDEQVHRVLTVNVKGDGTTSQISVIVVMDPFVDPSVLNCWVLGGSRCWRTKPRRGGDSVDGSIPVGAKIKELVDQQKHTDLAQLHAEREDVERPRGDALEEEERAVVRHVLADELLEWHVIEMVGHHEHLVRDVADPVRLQCRLGGRLGGRGW